MLSKCERCPPLNLRQQLNTHRIDHRRNYSIFFVIVRDYFREYQIFLGGRVSEDAVIVAAPCNE